MEEYKKIEETIKGFHYPDSFLKTLELKLLDFDFWFLMGHEQVGGRIIELEKRYPSRKLVPFAGRYDSDDIACFEVGEGEKVFIVHDFAQEGFERRQEFNNYWEWFINAIKEMIEYNS